MAEYIYTKRDGVSVFDLAKTADKLVEAMKVARDLGKKGKILVFVGTKRQAQAIIREEAGKIGALFVAMRWLGGTITNWEEIKKRIDRLAEMKKKRESGEYEKYTKKENVLLNREIDRLERLFGGIAELKQIPDALFIVDSHREVAAIKEARLKSVPVIAMVDSNADPDMVNHVIPVNDDAVRSIKLVVTKIAQAYGDGKQISKKGAKNTVGIKDEKDSKSKVEKETKKADKIKKKKAN